MSANNWAICPNCNRVAQNKDAAQKEEIDNVYGTVSKEAFLNVVANQKPTVIGCTLREDYEIGIYDGVFFVSYRGYCTQCGFEKEFEQKEVITVG